MQQAFPQYALQVPGIIYVVYQVPDMKQLIAGMIAVVAIEKTSNHYSNNVPKREPTKERERGVEKQLPGANYPTHVCCTPLTSSPSLLLPVCMRMPAFPSQRCSGRNLRCRFQCECAPASFSVYILCGLTRLSLYSVL